METADQQSQPTSDEGTLETPSNPTSGAPTPASLPSDPEPGGDAREGDDEHEGEGKAGEQSGDS